MSPELRKLVKRRAAIKSSVEGICHFMSSFNATSQSTRYVSTRLAKLNDLMNTFSEIQEALIELDEGHEEEVERLKFEDTYYTLKSDMENIISKHSTNDVNSSHSSQASAIDTIRLPAIQPPVFSGSLEDWTSFIDTFNALFHNNLSLNDVQRLHYLKTSVSGPAADIIKNFSITAENYTVAYNELVRQYENKGLTIQSHIRSLLCTPKVIVASAGELRNMHHHVASHVRALKALGQPVQHWDAWLVTLICSQLDATTVGEWQLRQDSKELPTYDQIENFLSKRVAAYEAGLISNKPTEETNTRNKCSNVNRKALFIRSSDDRNTKCPVCSGTHKIYTCEQFNKMSIADRKQVIIKSRLCFNCLNFGHQVKACRCSACTKCGKKHNSKLHEDSSIELLSTSQSPNDPLPNSQQATSAQVLCAKAVMSQVAVPQMNVMLATAVVNVYDHCGQIRQCRAVLDSGSQMHFITHSFAKSLGLKLSNGLSSISGIGSMTTSAQSVCEATIFSRFGHHKYNIQLYSLPVIVQALPSHKINCHTLNIPDHIKDSLADPRFHNPGTVDVLLGAEIFFDILQQEKWSLSKSAALHQSKFGWIVTGKLPSVSNLISSSSFTVLRESALSLFTSQPSSRRYEEDKAEAHFRSTVSRSPNGRFVVKLPLLQDPNVLGDSRDMARRRFLTLEKRLLKDSSEAEQYRAFMAEYLSLDHMEPADTRYKGPTYYLPHHAVFKTDSTTTKLRVVFDGSAAASSGLSLNDIMIKGPKVQADLINILWRFRIHTVAITADVEKMYRQISVSPEDCELQRIYYRSSPEEPLQEYKLKTVTYGTKSASYLSTRCLAQIADDCADGPLKRIISQDFYVDDLITGSHSSEKCYALYNSLQSTLNSYGFVLRKWCSNSQELMEHIPDSPNDPNFIVKLDEGSVVNTLGLSWQPGLDNFRFSVKPWHPPARMTKRSLLSDINSVFDPIGLLSPVLIKGKIFLQQLWMLKLGWDVLLPDELQLRWTRFYSSLQFLNQVVISRRVLIDDSSNIEIHAFSDASQVAFGSCVYIRSVDRNDRVQVRLYTSKSRVAPLKPSTIPRLELCGALLAAELVGEILDELKLLSIALAPANVYFWSDSSIVISWIQGNGLFQTYVSNRLARILDVSTPNQWHHVPTIDNPADLISRGIDPVSIVSSTLWWQGPPWLASDRSNWPRTMVSVSDLPETRKVKLVLTSIDDASNFMLGKFSRWMPLIRTTAWLRRFINNSRISSQTKVRHSGPLTVQELQDAKMLWIRIAQQSEFICEFHDLSNKKMVSNKSRLKTLQPFVDTDGFIRVGGRLQRSTLPYMQRHPLVIPSKHKVTSLLYTYEHERLLHAGPQALLSHIRQHYWPLRGMALARSTVHKCMVCFRFNPALETPVMAPLPPERVAVGRAFSRSGVDLCGPFFIKSGIRRVVSKKCYVSVFICFATRAIHLELVSDLSTPTFLAALTRFMSRRGLCSHIHSDNGTNFVGAAKVLKNYLQSQTSSQSVVDLLANEGVQWHFIPPSAPHFGGLWEAAVKSAKHHLLKVTKGALLSFEEMNTLLCRVEVILNSRPLTAFSSDPSDLQVLTPSHFLVGGPAMLPMEPDVSNTPTNRLRQFELVRARAQTFWKRWSKEYLPQLQRRGRWTSIGRAIAVGDLAILKDEGLPPLQWKLVRVIAVHPGSDGVVRVVTVKQGTGIELRRPVVKLALLPTPEE